MSIRILLCIAVMGLFGEPVHAKHLHKEKEYQQSWCNRFHGQTEVRLDDGTRADCITDKYAVEFDFAGKWAESLGQALHYSDLTGKRPAVVLIIERPNDWKHLRKLKRSTKKRAVKVWYMQPKDIGY